MWAPQVHVTHTREALSEFADRLHQPIGVTSPRSARLVVRSRNERKSFERRDKVPFVAPAGAVVRKIFFLKQERRDGLTVWHSHKTQMEIRVEFGVAERGST